MLEAIITTLSDACSPKWCSRLSLVGVILLSFWAVGHAADNREQKATAAGHDKTIEVVLQAAQKERQELKAEIEKNRVETNARLQRIEDLLLEIARTQRTRRSN